MGIERSIICRVNNLNENNRVMSLGGPSKTLSVTVDMEQDDQFLDPLLVSITVDADNQPKIGDKYVVSIRPATPGDME